MAVTCKPPLTHMESYTTSAVLQDVELYSLLLLVIPAVEHAKWGSSNVCLGRDREYPCTYGI